MLKTVFKYALAAIVFVGLLVYLALSLYYLELFKPYEGARFDKQVWEQNGSTPQCVRGRMVRDIINNYGRALNNGDLNYTKTLLGNPDYHDGNEYGECLFYHLGFCSFLHPAEFSIFRVCYDPSTQKNIDVYYYTTTEVKPLKPDPSLKTFREIQEELKSQGR